jgi:Tfp pilus assembly major pilin PilA
MFKKQNGITLVALVITIIVLLILAGVTISMVVGQNGVLSQAKSAATKTKDSEAKEALELALSGAQGTYVGGDMSEDFFEWLTAGADAEAQKTAFAKHINDNISKDFTATVKSINATTDSTPGSAVVEITKGTEKYEFTVTKTGAMGVTVAKN